MIIIRKISTIFKIVILIGLVIFFLRFVLGGPEDDWICVNEKWIKHGVPSAPIPAQPCSDFDKNWPKMLAGIVAGYVIIVFGASRFIIPHFGFGSDPVPEKIPDSMLEKIDELKIKANGSKENFLELTYNYLGNKYHSERFNTVFKFHYMFKNLDDIWGRIGFIPCNQSNFLLKTFLVKSGFFREDEIRPRYAFLNFVPHQIY